MIIEGHGSEGGLRGWGRNKEAGSDRERCNRRCHEDRGMGCRDAELKRRMKGGRGGSVRFWRRGFFSMATLGWCVGFFKWGSCI